MSVQNLGLKLANQLLVKFSERYTTPPILLRTIVHIPQCHWFMQEKARYPLLSSYFLFGEFFSNASGPSPFK